jgi:hypothetical protein
MQFTRGVFAHRIYLGACAISLARFVLTVVDPQWIERWLDESPDGGDGSAERWLVSGCFAALALVSAALARRARLPS